ncbi:MULTISPECIES: DUF5658 family protein [Bacillus]|uniref:DUF5658 family protein n=1 Tax=Bacillus TaxID=1386 RepID=UPI000BB80C4C|nr:MULTISPECIES: DUF5658 family protein [Bacillus]
MSVSILFKAILLLNVLDTIATFIGLHLGLITEANPFMAFLYETEPVLFVFVKLLLSLCLLLFILLKKVPTSNLVKVLSVLALISYSSVSLLHLTWITALII